MDFEALNTADLTDKKPQPNKQETQIPQWWCAKEAVLCYNTEHMKNGFMWSNLTFPFPDTEWDRKRVLGSWERGRLALIYGLKAFLFKLFHTEGQLHRKKYICMKWWRFEALNKSPPGTPALGRKVITSKWSKQFFVVVTPAPGKFCRTSCASSQSDLHFFFLLSE